ncbi:MAG: pyruvate dehydrogenase (acetyl-transferring), homodimeric type [Candidatus Binatia bacterium]
MAGENVSDKDATALDRIETREWLESLDYVAERGGPSRVRQLFRSLQQRAAARGISLPFSANTPYVNTIPRDRQPPFPGIYEIERRIRRLVRWNAMVMVVRANREEDGIGGHLSTFASACTLFEVAFNHFLRGHDHPEGGDQVYFQGHAAPGIYARAFLEGRLSVHQLENFRRELRPGGGLSSYPHPWLMPNFWEFPTVSMGLSSIMAIYHARFNRYLEDRGLATKTGRVWAFLGDGELDEPESLGAISLAAREQLENLIFVVNCNLQRLDGPVRGNGKIIQELEGVFRGAGWNVIKVIWGDSWDPLLEHDQDGVLAARMEAAVDGDYQMYSVAPGSYTRKHFFGTDPRLDALVAHLSDDDIRKLKRGGHDPVKMYAAYHAAVTHRGAPSVILAKTIKGYGLGEAGEGRNISHQQKKLNEEELREFRTRFGIPISDEDLAELPFYRAADDSAEMGYLHERRKQLGGYLPARRVTIAPLQTVPEEPFTEFVDSANGRAMATTMAFVRLLAKLLRDPSIGRLIVPIVPDEARTFGLEALFRQVGIYSHVGQRYEPVDKETLLYYKEATDGQILEEGITEAGAMSSFIAAGTGYATHGVNTIPFFLFYSMFGFQRVGDLIWAAADSRVRGFLLGCTAGRTTLAGEGLQHQDGHSQLLACTHPTVAAYDPAFAYEVAVIVREGIRRMFVEQQDGMYYLTLGNESYDMPAMPAGASDGIIRGMYCLQRSASTDERPRTAVLGSGALINEALRAQALLESDYGVAADVWSVTSYQQLYRDAVDAERWNRLHPEEPPRIPYVTQCLGPHAGPVIAVSDYTHMLPYSVARWVPTSLVALGTDGFGRSESRQALRDHFEVDARYVVVATLGALCRRGDVPAHQVSQAIKHLGIDPEKVNPRIA